MGPKETTPPTSNRNHPVRCTSRTRSWTHGRAQQPRAYTSIPRATLVEIAHGPRGEHPAHEQPQIILCAAQVGSTYGPMGEHRIHQHTRASCTLHKLETLMGPWESAPSSSIHEHPVRCTGKNRSWAHGTAPHLRETTSTLCAAQVGIAHGSMGQRPTHEDPRTPCAPLK